MDNGHLGGAKVFIGTGDYDDFPSDEDISKHFLLGFYNCIYLSEQDLGCKLRRRVAIDQQHKKDDQFMVKRFVSH